MMETQSLEIQYENISVHAISRGGEGAEFPLPSLLMLVEGCLPAGLNANRDQVHQITGNGKLLFRCYFPLSAFLSNVELLELMSPGRFYMSDHFMMWLL